ncbi:MAG TPA: hypothetical protein VFD21_09125 [Vicinamibacterales bacterium]|nr:hypothetical protein [Vicinamibacterales bacterium]
MYLRPTRPQLPTNCNYSTQDPFDNRPVQPVITLQIQFTHEATPDPEAVDNAARILKQQRGVVVDSIQGLGDAAFGFGNELAGDLYVFRGGVETLHLSGSLTVEKLKPLALKALGGPGRTGYAYGGTRPGAPPAPTVTAANTPVVGGSSFSEAVYITPSEFLKQVKEVSLQIFNGAKAVPEATVRAYLMKALAARGITVRAGAPVIVMATFKELPPTPGASYQIHNIIGTLEFYTRVVVMRAGTPHLMMAAPARSYMIHEYIEANGLNKFVFGDRTFRDFNDMVAAQIEINLDYIDANNAIDDAPWPVKTWSPAQKAAADTQFLRLMSAGQVEKDVTDNIETAPRLELVQPQADDLQQVCPTPTSWRSLWNDVFRQTGWTAGQRQPDLTLRHTFYCRWEHAGPVADDIALRQSNGVFALNGRVVRKPVTLVTQQTLARIGVDDDAAEIAKYMHDVLEDFRQVQLEFGITAATALPPTPLRIAAGTASPDDPAARIGAHRIDSWERKWEAPFVPVAQYTSAQARRGRMILQGTVSRVALQGNFPQRLIIYFKESADNSVTVCTPSPDIFREFGTGFRGLIGRTLEVAGDVQGGCGLFVAQSNQFRVLSTETQVP